MMKILEQLDIRLLYWINKGLANPLADRFFPWITDFHKTSFFLFLLIPFLFVWILYKKKLIGFTFILFLILTLALNDFIGGQILKPFFERVRPSLQGLDVILRVPQTDGFSFISNHSANSFCLAFFCFFFFPKSGYVLFPLAFLIAISRVYIGVHFPSDILAGLFFGFLTSYLMSRILIQLQTWKKKQVQHG